MLPGSSGGLCDRPSDRRRRTHDRARDGTRGAGRRRAAAGPARCRSRSAAASGRPPPAGAPQSRRSPHRPGAGTHRPRCRPGRAATVRRPDRRRRARPARPALPVRRRRPRLRGRRAVRRRRRSPRPASRPATATGSSRSRSPASTPRGRVHDEYATLAEPRPRRRPGVRARHLQQRGPRRARRSPTSPARSSTGSTARSSSMHDGAFVERFLDAEFARARRTAAARPPRSARCGWPAGRCAAPTTRCARLARHAGRPDARHARPRSAAVRTIAALLPQMLAAHGEPLRYLCGLRPDARARRATPTPATRPVEPVRESTDGWMATLLARRRLPTAAAGRSTPSATSTPSPRRWPTGGCSAARRQTLTRLGASAGPGRRPGRGPARPAARAPARGRAQRRDPDHRADPPAPDGGERAGPSRPTSTSCAPPRRRTWWPPAPCRWPARSGSAPTAAARGTTAPVPRGRLAAGLTGPPRPRRATIGSGREESAWLSARACGSPTPSGRSPRSWLGRACAEGRLDDRRVRAGGWTAPTPR